jgi:hypothetical protein
MSRERRHTVPSHRHPILPARPTPAGPGARAAGENGTHGTSQLALLVRLAIVSLETMRRTNAPKHTHKKVEQMPLNSFLYRLVQGGISKLG